MWVTVVRDQFGTGQRADVRDALEEIASPLDLYGWSSAGLYSFWDPDTREIKYVGLAIDLPNRFAQHTGLMSCPPTGCKITQINQWFDDGHDALGYSVMLQTPNVQPINERAAKDLGTSLAELRKDPHVLLRPLAGELEDVEGRLIEHHRLMHGKRPEWNAIGGSAAGAKRVQDVGPDDLFDVLAGVKDSPLVARRTIRELASDPTAVAYEEHLHTARVVATMAGTPGGTLGPAELIVQLEELPDGIQERARRMSIDGYLTGSSPFCLGPPWTLGLDGQIEAMKTAPPAEEENLFQILARALLPPRPSHGTEAALEDGESESTT
jgi:hypothetical protein